MRTLLPLLLAITTPLAASEVHPVDLRLTVLLTPETEPVEATYFTGTSGGQTEGDSLDPGWRVEVGLVTRVVDLTPATALVGGGWVFYGEQESGSSTDLGMPVGPRSYLVLGIDLYLAWRAQFTHWLGMEIGPIVGAGTTRFSDHLNGGEEEVGHGEYQEAAMNLQFLIRNPTRTAVVGVGVRYLVSYGEADNQVAGMEQDVEVTQHGFAPFLTVGMTF